MIGSDVPVVLTSMQEKSENLIVQDRGCRDRPGLLSRWVLFLDDNARHHTARDTKKNTFAAWDGRDWITRPTVPILPHHNFTFFLQGSRNFRDVTSEAMKRCFRL
ncbi:hypothetical protein AVEN_199136-1 [Araneus ventricosus]|uniref:Uncharacterized protein n=1 Tax=Araneus ventricosus TaxID=182803 RepID=A0A4Y2CKB5_ARAVE|nr:hypothetical protein AVEN_199136-1 [Araneus ventricosus]